MLTPTSRYVNDDCGMLAKPPAAAAPKTVETTGI